MTKNGHKAGQGVSVIERPRRMALADIDRHFDQFMRAFPRRFSRTWATEAWLPEIDVFEREGKIVLRADLPGMKTDDIEVTVEGDLLTVSGKRAEEKEVKEENYYYSERSRGEFSRSIRLPEGVSADAVEASYKDGVLEVTATKPVQTEATTTKVPVK
jgi:HSP20 family protein